MTVSYLA